MFVVSSCRLHPLKGHLVSAVLGFVVLMVIICFFKPRLYECLDTVVRYFGSSSATEILVV